MDEKSQIQALERTAPLLPLLALSLAAEGLPVVLHGGDPMPVKYGATLAELFAALGLEWRGLELAAVQRRLDQHGLALTHQPEHFAAAERLVRITQECLYRAIELVRPGPRLGDIGHVIQQHAEGNYPRSQFGQPPHMVAGG